MHTRGVSIFGEVECRFKRTLATAWEPTPATHSLAGAVKDPSARSVTVPLGGRQARFIQCHFFFAGEWMLFSESYHATWPPDPPGLGILLQQIGSWVQWLGDEMVGWVMGSLVG
ncbi:hypothetical protein QYF61_000609 [Mycteria americana]|uniref:Discoidin domain-containing protein n=1 Tax=Mycteria americana TaxID=33587 RepID=A0AAN7RG88_MYCAM|nr:hypothetical protein QYF61_000609 [Mycteria americana]